MSDDGGTNCQMDEGALMLCCGGRGLTEGCLSGEALKIAMSEEIFSSKTILVFCI